MVVITNFTLLIGGIHRNETAVELKWAAAIVSIKSFFVLIETNNFYQSDR